MGTTDVDVYRGSNLDARIRYAQLIADARGLLPAGVATPAQALLIFEQASALGIPPITGLSQIHIIKGRPTMSAALMTGLIRQAGHKLRVWVEGEIEDESLVAYAELIRSDDPDFTFKAKYTLKDARRAGLFPGKEDSNWRKHPRSMAKARVTSEIAKEGATDVFIGAIYTPDELDESLRVDDHGELVSTPAAPDRNLTPETTESSHIGHSPDNMPAEVRQEWFDKADAIKDNADALGDLYQEIRRLGYMGITHPDDPDAKLVDYVVALGKAAKAAAEAGEVVDGVPVDPEDGPPAVLDPDVVDAEVVEDEPQEPAEEPQKPAARARTRKPANASEAPAEQG